VSTPTVPLPPISAGDLLQVLDQVAAERARQDRMWGEQNHPDVTGSWLDDPAPRNAHVTAVMHYLPTADTARTACAEAFDSHSGTWAHIAVEELAEAVEAAALRDTPGLRTELIQTAAVLVAWVQAIDRRKVRA
jgi:hypothetical protein